jgi:hypothetical protein
MAPGGREHVFDQDIFFSLGEAHMNTLLLIFFDFFFEERCTP